MLNILKKAWATWKIIARAIGTVQAWVILFLIYFTAVAITSLIAKLFRADLLKKRFCQQNSYWIKRDDFKEASKRVTSQF